ncbi:thiol-disulfide oxidoreductase DCC family protein [Streptomyces parvulus]|uniref:thiol-disulfide oxidoreductase DCC family protein n=1 Tax=Streptomyces parvulus TaxID=146923 RepID=UPI0033D80185
MRTLPVLVYDGDCGFCTASVRMLERRVRPRCVSVARQRADLGALGVGGDRARHEVLWVTPVGTVYGGSDAVAKLLLSAGGAWSLLGAALLVPVARNAARVLYRLVADNRSRLPGRTEACSVAEPRRT